MFTQTINQRSFYYANYVSKAAAISEETGLPSGAVTRTFSTPTQTYGNVSSASGRMSTDGYGWNIDYDVSIVPVNGSLITEGAKLWLNTVPPATNDYQVVRVARSLNETVIMAKRLAGV